MKMNNKGYMIIEIILASALTFGLIYFILDLTINLKNKNDDLFAITQTTTDTAIISNKFMSYIKDENTDFDCDKINIDEENNIISYNGETIVQVNKYAKINLDNSDKICFSSKDYVKIDIPIGIPQIPNENFDIDIYYEFSKSQFLTCEDILNSYSCANKKVGNSPYTLTYDGSCTVIDDKNGNCRVKFLTTGKKALTIDGNFKADVFLVGGGGGGSSTSSSVGGGGGGGYTKTVKNIVFEVGQYTVNVGAGGNGNNSGTGKQGGASLIMKNNNTYLNMIAAGGYGGRPQSGIYSYGGNGGSGGGGWSDLNDGTPGAPGSYGNNGYGSKGQIAQPGPYGETGNTREFGESNGQAYSGGGTSGCCYSSAGGGGSCNGAANVCYAGSTNTGGGGGAYYRGAKSGGSGIVIIRNAR